jgi:hypothetical protein
MPAPKRGSLISFSYKKDDGSITQREVIVVSPASPNIFGYDVTGKSATEVSRIQKAISDIVEAEKKIISDSGLGAVLAPRSFTEAKISNLKITG